MDLGILEISLGNPVAKQGKLVGHLFRYGAALPNGVIRFVPAQEYVGDAQRPTLSLLFADETEEETQRHLLDITAAEFNGQRHANGSPDSNGLAPFLLPAWFQNLLPEGAFRTHIAEIRQCSESDHFEILAACGADLPGAVFAYPVKEPDTELKRRLVTQDQDSLEASVIDIPQVDGISLSGVQPKLGVNIDAQGRYVARTKLDEFTHIVAKLPAVDYPLMPEVEHLSMHLARLAGADVCDTHLVPLERLAAQHKYDLGDPDLKSTNFLVVPRYDRKEGRRVHAEDFAQAFGFHPHEKYSKDVSYSVLMQYMLEFPSLGESAVLELLRRIAINELLGNPDCHLKNIGVYFPDGKTPELPPAYDIVAHHVYTGAIGHALFLLPAHLQKDLEEKQNRSHFEAFVREHGREPAAQELSAWRRLLLLRPSTIKALAEEVGLPFKILQKVVAEVVKAASDQWPGAIEASLLTSTQKAKMNALLERHPAVQGYRKREHS